MNRFQRNLQTILLLALVLPTAGCTATALQRQRFQDFARVGVEYTQAMDEFLSAAGATYIQVDSQQLLRNRAMAQELEGAEGDSASVLLEEELERADADLETLLGELDLLRRHGQELSAYFKALAALAETEVAEPLTTEVERNFLLLDGLSQRIRGGSLFQDPEVTARAGAEVGSFIVERVRVAELNQELTRRKQAIAQELLLHEALLELLEQDLGEIRRRQAEWAYDEEVRLPFMESPVLHTGPAQVAWARRRSDLLLAANSPGEIQGVAQLAADVRSAWTALLSDRLGVAEVEALLLEAADVLEVVSLLSEGFGPGESGDEPGGEVEP